MTPIHVSGPASGPITLAEVKAYLRVRRTDEDGLIDAHIASATAYLDGWSGVLGRCIALQEWRVTVTTPGCVVLPMPDVMSATAGYAAGAADLDVTASPAGPVIEVAEACDVTFTCAMPDRLLPVVQTAIKLLVSRDYDRLEGAAYDGITRAVDSIVDAIRWRAAA